MRTVPFVLVEGRRLSVVGVRRSRPVVGARLAVQRAAQALAGSGEAVFSRAELFAEVRRAGGPWPVVTLQDAVALETREGSVLVRVRRDVYRVADGTESRQLSAGEHVLAAMAEVMAERSVAEVKIRDVEVRLHDRGTPYGTRAVYSALARLRSGPSPRVVSERYSWYRLAELQPGSL